MAIEGKVEWQKSFPAWEKPMGKNGWKQRGRKQTIFQSLYCTPSKAVFNNKIFFDELFNKGRPSCFFKPPNRISSIRSCPWWYGCALFPESWQSHGNKLISFISLTLILCVGSGMWSPSSIMPRICKLRRHASHVDCKIICVTVEKQPGKSIIHTKGRYPHWRSCHKNFSFFPFFFWGFRGVQCQIVFQYFSKFQEHVLFKMVQLFSSVFVGWMNYKWLPEAFLKSIRFFSKW